MTGTNISLATIIVGISSYIIYYFFRDRLRAWWEGTEASRGPSPLLAQKHWPGRYIQIYNNPGLSPWETRDIFQPLHYAENLTSGLPVLVVANLKGGVGKTTVAAHLAAYYASKGEKVLAIDLDFQGSMSSMLLKRLRQKGEIDAYAAALVEGKITASNINQYLIPTANYGTTLHVMPSFYPVALSETRTMVTWLGGQENRDIRYFLAELLGNPSVKSRFDRVIIDAPPRMTTGTVQALCAGTHLLIPTMLDHLSAEPITNFLQQIKTLKLSAGVMPHLQIAGVVGTMINPPRVEPAGGAKFPGDTLFVKYEQEECRFIADRLSQYQAQLQCDVSLLPDETFVPEMGYLHKMAGKRLAFSINDPISAEEPRESKDDRTDREKVQRVFADLGEVVRSRMAMAKKY
jgi:cellulose biosynthesis protein BcsQ